MHNTPPTKPSTGAGEVIPYQRTKEYNQQATKDTATINLPYHWGI